MVELPKKQQQCLIPRYLLKYIEAVNNLFPDPSDIGSGGGDGFVYYHFTFTKQGNDYVHYTYDEDKLRILSKGKAIIVATMMNGEYESFQLTFYPTDNIGTYCAINFNFNLAGNTVLEYYPLTVDGNVLSTRKTHSDLIPVKVSQLENDEGFVTNIELASTLLDYAELDDIPTKTSDLTNDSGFITSSALTGYATETWVTNQGYSTFSGSYNDLTDKPTIPAVLSGGTWINIDSNNSINVYNPYISLVDGSGNPRVMISSTSNGTAPTFTATYCNITPTGFGIVDKTQGPFGGYNPSYTYYRHRNILVNNKWTLSFPTDDGTIATQEWITDQGYSKTSGSYSGDYWTSITINGTTKSIPSGGSGPTNMVTTNTDQDINGTKTFVGSKKIRLRQANTSDVVGFTVYNTSQREIGNLQVANRTVGGNTYTYVTLGNYSDYSSKSKLGFRVHPNGSTNSYNFVMPYGTNAEFTSNAYSTSADTTIPCAFTDGTTIVKADATGLVNISSISGGGGGGTTVSGTNDGTNWTSLTIGSDTYGIPSGGGGGGSSLAPQIYNFTSSDWTGLTSTNAYINSSAMTREGLDLTTLSAGQTVKIDCIFVRPSNSTSYVHQFTLVIPDGNMATESTDTFQIPGTNQTDLQIEAWMQISNNRIGLYWNNPIQTRYISKVKVYPANA